MYKSIQVRWVITALLPNLVVKRGMYNLKIRTNEYCLDGINKILYSKSSGKALAGNSGVV